MHTKPITHAQLRRAYIATWAMWRLCDLRDLAHSFGFDIARPVDDLQRALGRIAWEK